MEVIFKIDMPKAVLSALDILKSGGFDSYVVGGCVRDSILKRIPSDWDITTSALPNQIKNCFGSYKTIDTGIKHGTVTVLVDGFSIEITTFRIDGDYLDSRHPESVVFTNKIEDDLSRRDFTINAMAYSPDDGLIDVFGGLDDINAHIMRCVGDAKTRFEEDALRILRMFRFAAQLGFTIDEKSLTSGIECAHLLKRISKERIATELNKIFLSENPEPILELLSKNGIMNLIIPQWEFTVGFDQKSIFHDRTIDMHIIQAVGNYSGDDLVVKLALLLHDIGKPSTFTVDEDGRGHFYGHDRVGADMSMEILRDLKYDNQTINSVHNLVYYHDQKFETKYSVNKILGKLGETDFYRLIEVKKADALAHIPDSAAHRLDFVRKMIEFVDEIITEESVLKVKDLAIDGNDLKNMGFVEGRKIGDLLNNILDMVMRGDIQNDRDVLLKYSEECFCDFERKK